MRLRAAAFIAVAAAGISAATCGEPDTTILSPAEQGTIEGVWQISGNGAIFDIKPEPGYSGRYKLTIIDSPDYSVVPGSFFGTLAATATPGQYDAAVSIDPEGKTGSSIHPQFHIRVRRITLPLHPAAILGGQAHKPPKAAALPLPHNDRRPRQPT